MRCYGSQTLLQSYDGEVRHIAGHYTRFGFASSHYRIAIGGNVSTPYCDTVQQVPEQRRGAGSPHQTAGQGDAWVQAIRLSDNNHKRHRACDMGSTHNRQAVDPSTLHSWSVVAMLDTRLPTSFCRSILINFSKKQPRVHTRESINYGRCGISGFASG